MNRRYLVLAALVVIMILVGSVTAKWSICDPNDKYCQDVTLPYATAQGYWNFEYDEAAPYTTAGLYCCWWERWYKWQKYSQWKGENTLNLGSDDNKLSGFGTPESTPVPEVKTESFCPSCCATCDDDAPGELEARSAAIMAKKPWLTEGKTKEQPSAVPTATVAPVETQPQMVMSFSDPE